MTPCPTNNELDQLIADRLSSDRQQQIDQHLEECPACRTRMDELAHVSEVSVVMAGAASHPYSDSVNLKLVMDRLQNEASSMITHLNTPSTGVQNQSTLPHLQPTLVEGYIGRLGQIQIKRLIGRGGMGVVFEGVDPALHRTVAVKVLSPHLLEREEAKSRFLREAQAAAALAHENVVAIHAINEAEGMPYLVLQYIAGESLAERLQRMKKLPVDDVIRLGKEVARGLAAAHDRGMVHRDIKPGNILLDAETGTARVTDFGLAKHVGLETVTEVGMVAGTPAYMSPEQAVDGVVDARSDLFSLGVMLYQAASGELPFTAESPFVLLNQIRTAPEKPLQEVAPELPGWFCSIVHRLLKKEPENRVASAHELVRMLEDRVDLSVADGPGSRRPSKYLWPIVLAAFLICGGVVGLLLLPTSGETRRTASGLTGFVVAGQGQPFATLAEAVEAAPDQGVIEVHGDGPYSTSTIKINSKRLTIRAGPGAYPRFVPEVTGDGGFMQFIVTNADLTLEGLEIYWPLKSPLSKSDDPSERSIILSTQNRLTVRYCRIVGATQSVCLGAGGQDVVIERCHIISPAGTSLGWRTSTYPVKIEHNIMECRHVVNILRPNQFTSKVRSGIYLADNTIVAERLVNLLLENNTKNTFSFTACRNTIDSPVLFTLVALPKNPLNLTKPEIMKESLQSFVAWSEENNIYRKRIAFLTSVRAAQLTNLFYSDLKQIDQWLMYGKMEQSGSIEASFQYVPRGESGELTPLRISRIEAPSGAVPKEYGADPAQVGPGRPYQAWVERNRSVPANLP